jgi:hypothetical protein
MNPAIAARLAAIEAAIAYEQRRHDRKAADRAAFDEAIRGVHELIGERTRQVEAAGIEPEVAKRLVAGEVLKVLDQVIKDRLRAAGRLP